MDTNSTIRRISVKVIAGNTLRGLRLLDNEGRCIVDRVWDTLYTDGGDWVTQEIPEGKEIIGVQCNATKFGLIPRLGFFLWSPRPSAIAPSRSATQFEQTLN